MQMQQDFHPPDSPKPPFPAPSSRLTIANLQTWLATVANAPAMTSVPSRPPHQRLQQSYRVPYHPSRN